MKDLGDKRDIKVTLYDLSWLEVGDVVDENTIRVLENEFDNLERLVSDLKFKQDQYDQDENEYRQNVKDGVRNVINGVVRILRKDTFINLPLGERHAINNLLRDELGFEYYKNT